MGRQILDVILIASEVVGNYKAQEKEGLLLKLDFEKAYDRVDWEYLDAIFELKGFRQRWRKLIRGVWLIQTSPFCLMVDRGGRFC